MSSSDNLFDCIVIGAGQTGLSAGYHLQKAGVNFLIVEARPEVTGSFGSYYDSLKLFSPAAYSQLPGLAMGCSPTHYPSRTEYIRYLQDYASHFALPLQLNTPIDKVENGGEGFSLHSPNGVFRGRTLINATGPFSQPYLPQYPGQEDFEGKILHAYEYRNTAGLEGKRVIVVGAGNSAVQIADELKEVAKVSIASRRKIKWVSQKILGKDLHFWLHRLGIDLFPLKKPPKGGIPVIDTSGYRKSMKKGLFDRRPMFQSFTSKGVVWADGTEEVVDAVIFATGYRPRYPWLDGLGAQDDRGFPQHRRGVSLKVPGLYFGGLFLQRNAASGNARGAAFDAEYVVRRALHHLGRNAQSEKQDARQTAWRQRIRKRD